jgi:hypothetical protein
VIRPGWIGMRQIGCPRGRKHVRIIDTWSKVFVRGTYCMRYLSLFRAVPPRGPANSGQFRASKHTAHRHRPGLQRDALPYGKEILLNLVQAMEALECIFLAPSKQTVHGSRSVCIGNRRDKVKRIRLPSTILPKVTEPTYREPLKRSHFVRSREGRKIEPTDPQVSAAEISCAAGSTCNSRDCAQESHAATAKDP